MLSVACMAANEEFKIKDKYLTLATKTKLVYSYMFRVVTLGSESWTLCKAMETECIRNMDLETITKNQLN